MPQKAATTQNYLYGIRLKSTPKLVDVAVFSCNVAEDVPGRIVLEVAGDEALELFSPEQGGHRFQRIPPTEKRGRKQSSTVTVAILGQSKRPEPAFDERDVEYRYCVASVGAGGQNRQKNETACVAKHVPTGVEAKCEDERSRKSNKRKALATLRQRVLGAQQAANHQATNVDRSNQIGSGERGDKIRTVQVNNSVVTNHLTGSKMNLDRYLKGYIEDIQ